MEPELLGAVIHWLEGEGANLTGAPHLRSALSALYPAVLAMYTLVLVAAVLANCCLVLFAYRNRLYLLLNLGLANLLLSCPVLPPTVAVLIFHDWLLGRTACHLLPLLQDMSLHLTILSHLALAVDGYRKVRGLSRLSPITISLAMWFMAVFIVLPYRPYITYSDLAVLGSRLHGVGICTASLTDHIREYIRSVVLLAYFVPVCIMLGVYINMRRAVQSSLRLLSNTTGRTSRSEAAINHQAQGENTGKSHCMLRRREVQQRYVQVQYLGVMLTLCNVCICPLMTLRVIKTRLVETPDSSGSFDLLYCVFVWLAFLPTLSSPLLILYSEYRRTGTGNLREYLSRRRLRDCENPEVKTSRVLQENPACSLLSRPSEDAGHNLGITCL